MRKVRKVILLVKTSRKFERELLRGIAKYSRIHGAWAWYSADRRNGGTLPYLSPQHATGMIACCREAKRLEEFTNTGLPSILASTHKKVTCLPSIVCNNAAIANMAAKHLVERGFRHFAFCGFSNVYWSQGRCEAFYEVIARAGFQTHVFQRPIGRGRRSWDKEQALIADWIKSVPKPVGLMACNDDRAIHVIKACRDSGLYVPEEVAVVGVDNDDLVCELCDPPISSVDLNTERAGYEAAELLDKWMAGEKMAKEQILIQPTQIVVRRSTTVLAIDDQVVSMALRFIRQHSKELIQVGDVVAEVGLSRRPLQKRFRRILGRSIHEEIRRTHVKEFVRMLLETNMSVSQIAFALGYPSDKHIARIFRREKGMTPLAYRREYGRI